MNAMLGRLEPFARTAMRLAIGFLFWVHGAQKLLGWFGREPVELMSRFGIAGVLEFVGGLAIMVGAFTQPVAFILSGEMAVAYFWIHAPRHDSIWPWANRGEVVALYSFIFLFLAASGAGTLSVDHLARRSRAAGSDDASDRS